MGATRAKYPAWARAGLGMLDIGKRVAGHAAPRLSQRGAQLAASDSRAAMDLARGWRGRKRYWSSVRLVGAADPRIGAKAQHHRHLIVIHTSNSPLPDLRRASASLRGRLT